MPPYKHTQVSYPIFCIASAILIGFIYLQATARAETPSVDSGTNFALTAVMLLIVFVLESFITLTVTVDEQAVGICFTWGIVRKKFAVSEIASVKTVRNPWYYGWGIKLRLWPKMWIFSVAGYDAVELTMKNGTAYRIGTNEPEKLEVAIKRVAGV